MARSKGLPIVEASGKPYDMGRRIGKACSPRATKYRKSIEAAIKCYTGSSWSRALEKSKEYLPFAEEFFPDFVDEMRGYSSGSRLQFEEVFACCCHELLSRSGFKGCTDIAVSGEVTEDGHVLAAHNEDWSSDVADTVVLLRARPKGKPTFMCTAYAGILPSSGINDQGISITGNALEPNDMRVGIPKVFPVRKVLEARRIGEALEYAMPASRASSYNNICADRHGEIYSLEGSATECAWLYASDGYLVHTNHYVSDKMLRFESNPESISCSIFRYNRAKHLVEDHLGSITRETMFSILRDHANKPCSICRHKDPGKHPLDISETVFSLVYDLTSLEAHVCGGSPCRNDYKTSSLMAM